MAIEGNFDQWPVTAGQDLTDPSVLHKAATIAGTIAASTSRIGGVLRSKGKTGEQVSVVYQGVTKVMVGVAINTLGYPLTVTTSGWFIAASSGGAQIGRALSTAASGDLVPALVDFKTVPAWPGV